MGNVYLRGEIWWVRFSVKGKRMRFSSNSTDRNDALRLLKKKLNEAQEGKALDSRGVTFDTLATMLLDDYRVNGRRSSYRAQGAIKRLREFFGDCKAQEITSDRVVAYVAHRFEQGVAAGTVNLETSFLRHAFKLALDSDKLAVMPRIKLLKLHNVRKGFFENDELDAVLQQLPEYLHPVILMSLYTGWRKSEVLTRTWKNIDFANNIMRIEPNESKNGEAREYPLADDLLELLQAQRAHVSKLERAYGKIIPHVFVRPDGRQITDYRYQWKRACQLAGVQGKIVHDLRRTNVRNMERAGVPRSTAMKLSGHLTESIYKRYAITDAVMLREGAAMLASLYRRERVSAKGT